MHQHNRRRLRLVQCKTARDAGMVEPATLRCTVRSCRSKEATEDGGVVNKWAPADSEVRLKLVCLLQHDLLGSLVAPLCQVAADSQPLVDGLQHSHLHTCAQHELTQLLVVSLAHMG